MITVKQDGTWEIHDERGVILETENVTTMLHKLHELDEEVYFNDNALQSMRVKLVLGAQTVSVCEHPDAEYAAWLVDRALDMLGRAISANEASALYMLWTGLLEAMKERTGFQWRIGDASFVEPMRFMLRVVEALEEEVEAVLRN